MAKKWAEVVDSDAYQALPDAEKAAARDQYFDQVVAPKVPKDDVETARKQFLDSTSLGDESAFMRGVKSYVPQTKGMLGGAEAVIGEGIKKTFGPGPVSDYLVQHGLENYKEAEKEQKKVARATDNFEDAWKKGVGAVITEWLPYQVGSGVSNIMETGAASLAGAAVGSAMAPGAGTAAGAAAGIVEKTLIKKGIKEAAEKIFESEGKEAAEKYIAAQSAKTLTGDEGKALIKAGAKAYGRNAGMAAAAVTHGLGEVGNRALDNVKTPDEIDMSKLAPAVAVHSIADYAAERIGLGAFKGLTGPSKSLVWDVAKGMLATGAKEVPPELLQTAAERYGANLSLTDKKAVSDYINTTAGAFGMSVLPGGVGGFRGHFATPTDVPPPPAGQTNVPPPPPPPAGQTAPLAPGLAAEEQKPAITTSAPAPERKARIDEIASKLKGWEPEDAQREAERRVDLEDQQALEEQEAQASKVPSTPVETEEDQLTQDFIAAGHEPEKAKELALKQIKEQREADALAEEEEQNVGKPVTETSGVSTGAPVQPITTQPAAGLGTTQRDGMVSAEPNVGSTNVGETAQPAPVAEPTPAPALSIAEQVKALEEKRNQFTTAQGRRPSKGTKNRAQWDAITAERDALLAQQAQPQAQPQNQGVPPSGTETPEAVQTTQEGQEAPTAEQPIKETSTPTDRLVTSHDGEPWTYFYPGAEVVQSAYAGAPAKVVGVEERKHKPTLYKLEVDVSNHPEGLDENGNKINTAIVTLTDEQLNRLNPPKETPTEAAAVPAEPKQKRGPKGGPRPTTVPKTQEEKNEYNRVSKAADDAHKKLTPQLENPTSKAERETAIYNLLKHKKATQGRAVAKRIGETLAKHANAEDITKAEARIANETKGAKKTEVGHTTTVGTRAGRAAPNIRFNYAKNATQALQIVAKTGNAFQRLLAKKLIGFVGGVKFTSVVEGEPLPEALQDHIDMWNTARATYVYDLATGEKHIFVRADGPHQGINNIDVLHEALHAATLQKLRIGLKSLKGGYDLNSPLAKFARNIQDLMARAKKQYLEEKAAGYLSKDVIERIESVKEPNGDLTIFTDPDEFLAYGMSDQDVQGFLNLVKGVHTEESIFSKFVRSILNVFGLGDGYYTGLSDLVHITGGILEAQKTPMQRLVERGEKNEAAKTMSMATTQEEEGEEETPAEIQRTQKQVERAVDEAFAKVDQSRTAEEMAKGVQAVQIARNPKAAIPALRRLWAKIDYEKRKLLLKASTTEFLTDWAKDRVPELSNTYLLMQKMSGMMQNLLASGGELSKIIHNAYLEDPTLQRKLEDIALASTIAEVDPSNPGAKERSARLDKAYAELGPKGQEVFKLVKNHFEDLADYYTQLLNDQVSKSGLSIAEQANIMAKLRELYEKGKKISPYFPLVRRGDYWLAVGTGKTRQFYMYQSMQERDAAAQAMADEKIKQKPGESNADFEQRRKDNYDELVHDKEFRMGNDIKGLRTESYASSDLLKSIFSSIESSDLTDPDAKEALMDSIYQIYLNTMPEQSFRKQFINRKNITGFSTDFLQNVSSTTSKMAIQLARIKYASQMHNSLRDAKTSIEGRPELEPYVSEMRDRVANQLNPPPPTAAGAIASSLNKASFVWYLSGASSALLQPLSVFQTGVPVLSRYGAVNAARELTRMMKFWSLYGYKKTNADGSVNWVAPSLEHSKDLTPLERKAVTEMMARDVSKSTYASAIFEYKSKPTEKLHGPKMELAKNTVDALVLGGLMHSSERLSREMMYLASFRLNQQAGKDFKTSIDQAVTDTNEALGNYGTYNRPLVMQGPIGKLALQFTMYPLHVTTFLVKNFKEMIKPMNGRTKAEAAKKFFGTLMTTFILAGAVGLPGFSAVMGLLGEAWKDIFKDPDMPEDLRSMNPELWFRTVLLPEMFPTSHDVLERGFINKLTGLNVADRAGINNMFSRDTKETKTVRDSAMAMALEKSGPAANMLLSLAESYEAFMNGDYQKGVEKGVPAGFRNYVTAYKYATEGAKDYKGAPLLEADSFKKGELIGQAIGFRSDILSNAQYVNFEVSKLEQRINNQKTQLLNNLDREFRNSNNERFEAYLDKIKEFDAKYPSFAITPEEILNSIEKRAEQRAGADKGIVLTEHNVPLIDQAIRPSREALYERERQSP